MQSNRDGGIIHTCSGYRIFFFLSAVNPRREILIDGQATLTPFNRV